MNRFYASIQGSICDCGHEESKHSEITRGYGIDESGKTFCYDCCAERDRQFMRDEGRNTLYLVQEDYDDPYSAKYKKWFVKNWPGSLTFHPWRIKIGRHNIARKRYDVWFNFENNTWHGVTYGDNTQICHVKRVKH